MDNKILRRLDKFYAESEKIVADQVLFVSDLHMGDGGPADDFWRNRGYFRQILISYIKNCWKIFIVGDIYDLWQFRFKKVKEAYSWYFLRGYEDEEFEFHRADINFLAGNHDAEMGFKESVVIEGDPPIFVIHGHQAGDIWNYELWRVGRFATRYIWKPLEYFKFKDPISSQKSIRHEVTRNNLIDWAEERKVRVLCGHTHFHEHKNLYWNCGSCINEGIVERIELQNNILTMRR